METKTWVKINTEALKENYRNLSNLTEGKKMCVVKSNAYGHGIVECAKIFEAEGCDFLGVDSFEEAVLLRENGLQSPILVLGWTSPEKYYEAIEMRISVTISTLENLEKAPEELKIHIKADTGLHRQGFSFDEVENVIELSKRLNIEGLYTHLAAAETPELEEYTNTQIKRFKYWIEEFENNRLDVITHAGASAATIEYPETHFDMVRLGISLYGLWPSEEIKEVSVDINLTPALTWESRITEIKEIKAGEPIGYDCTEKVSRDSKIAVIPIGYWHGLPRSASRKAELIVRGKKCKILGNVSMDMISIDVTDTGAKVDDTVTIIGENVPVEELAKSCETINYEVVTRINQDISRIY